MTIATWLTFTQIQRMEGNKPLCRYCYAPCDPQSRDYRAFKSCPWCYDDYALQTLKAVKKETLCMLLPLANPSK